ncbi:MurR/RpiR family transcriptional regulator [Streptomyces sp. NPDC050433]|uniref:MurR/RpiR family transcriptional regulator n=1 Tax=Streptomyces sp. NPDC050433 TaxID=3365615 RepID=UPI003787C912
MSFYQSLEESTRSLTAAEQKIGSLLLADPRNAPFLRIAQIAKRAGVHDSTVVRFAQKLGYAGFIEMREALVADSLSSQDRTIAMREEGEAFSLAMVVSSQVEVLQSLPEKIPQERIDSTVEALLAADRIHVMGSGLMLPLVEFMRAKLSSAGLHVDTIPYTGREAAQRLAHVSPTDALLVFAFAEDYEKVAHPIRILEAEQTSIILLTDESSLMRPELPAHVIAIPRDQVRHGVIVPMTALCYAIHYDLLQYRTEERRATRQRTDLLDGGSPPAASRTQ